MSNQEEQEDEMEALEAIFENEFVIKEKTPPKFEILLEPCPGEGDDENHVRVRLFVTLPPEYPEVVPQISLEAVKGLNEKKVETLTKIAQDAADENKGDVSIFTVTEALKEWLADNNAKELGMHEEMLARAAAGQTKDKLAGEDVAEDNDDDGSDEDEDGSDEEEARETDWKEDDLKQRRQAYKNPLGIPVDALVTTESFNKWKIDFANHKRLEEEKAGVVREVVVESTKLTGRQFFQQQIAKTLKEEAKEGKTEEVFWFNDAIYDDDDLPDCSDDEDEDDDDDDDDDDEKEE